MAHAPLPYPPPWQDRLTLAAHLCISPETIENWVAAGIIPAPRKRGGKLMWKWCEVDAWMTDGPPTPDVTAGAIRENVRRLIAEQEAERAQRRAEKNREEEKKKARRNAAAIVANDGDYHDPA